MQEKIWKNLQKKKYFRAQGLFHKDYKNEN